MHRLTTTFVLGYHGCDDRIASRLLNRTAFRPSHNDYDWLGAGIYFWEANPRRGLEFAREVRKRQPARMRMPAVVGAIIDLGLCLDLSTSAGVAEIKKAHTTFSRLVQHANLPMPSNGENGDLWRRNLDRAVVEHLHATRRDANLPSIDTVRGFFFEGDRAYPGAGYFEKTHVQICVRNPACIHGVFRVPRSDFR